MNGGADEEKWPEIGFINTCSNASNSGEINLLSTNAIIQVQSDAHNQEIAAQVDDRHGEGIHRSKAGYKSCAVRGNECLAGHLLERIHADCNGCSFPIRLIEELFKLSLLGHASQTGLKVLEFRRDLCFGQSAFSEFLQVRASFFDAVFGQQPPWRLLQQRR